MSRLGVAVIALTLAAGPALAASVAARSGAAAQAAHAAPTTVTPQPAAPLPPQKTLHVGVEGAYPPFSEMTDDGKVKGFDIDFTNALCAEIRAKCLLVQDTFDHLQDDLVGGRVDMIVASLSMTDERRAHFSFTNRYYQVPAKFVAKRWDRAGPLRRCRPQGGEGRRRGRLGLRQLRRTPTASSGSSSTSSATRPCPGPRRARQGRGAARPRRRAGARDGFPQDARRQGLHLRRSRHAGRGLVRRRGRDRGAGRTRRACATSSTVASPSSAATAATSRSRAATSASTSTGPT